MFFCGCFCPSVAPSRRMRCASSFRVFLCRSFRSGPIVEGEDGVAFVISMFAEVLWSKRPRYVKGTTLQFERREYIPSLRIINRYRFRVSSLDGAVALKLLTAKILGHRRETHLLRHTIQECNTLYF